MEKIKNCIIGVLAVIVVVLGIFSFKFYNDYFAIRNEYKATLVEKASIVFNGRIIDSNDIIVEGDEILLSIAFIKEHINDEVHLSNSGSRLYVPINSKTNEHFEMETDYLTAFVQEHTLDINIPIEDRAEGIYIKMGMVKDLLGISHSYEYGDFLVLWTKDSEMLLGQATKKTALYSQKKLAFALTEISKDERVVQLLEADEEGYYNVVSKTGNLGKVKVSDFVSVKHFTKERTALNSVRDQSSIEKINLTWEQIGSYKANPDLNKQSKIESVNVLSPTWFRLNIDGIVLSEASKTYVDDAHNQGYEVWALFSNDFNPDRTRQMLSDKDYVNRAIGQVLMYASLYDLDGINIDFENMYIEDKNLYTSFIEKLSGKLKEQNLTVSIDVTVPWGSDRYSKVTDRVELAKHVDYVMLMAYDEHWASSPMSGPVASLPWTERGIVESLELIPRDKLILGMPLYTRIWEERGSGNSVKVSSSTLSSKKTAKFVAEKNASQSYDEENGMTYYTYVEDGNKYRVWAEDELSIKKRLSLYKKYELPGVATWSKKFADDTIWEIINSNF